MALPGENPDLQGARREINELAEGTISFILNELEVIPRRFSDSMASTSGAVGGLVRGIMAGNKCNTNQAICKRNGKFVSSNGSTFNINCLMERELVARLTPPWKDALNHPFADILREALEGHANNTKSLLLEKAKIDVAEDALLPSNQAICDVSGSIKVIQQTRRGCIRESVRTLTRESMRYQSEGGKGCNVRMINATASSASRTASSAILTLSQTLESYIQDLGCYAKRYIDAQVRIATNLIDAKMSRECSICFDSLVEVRFTACGHAVCCKQCALSMIARSDAGNTTCPICRQPHIDGQNQWVECQANEAEYIAPTPTPP